MNNRYKFRIWYVDESRFVKSVYHDHSDCYIFINAMYGNPVILSKYGEEVELDEKKYIVQQYTGLNDKSGKEIYEGEIVRANKQNETLIGFVQYDVLYGGNRLIASDILSFTFYQLTDLQVIGNIFNNQELLK